MSCITILKDEYVLKSVSVEVSTCDLNEVLPHTLTFLDFKPCLSRRSNDESLRRNCVLVGSTHKTRV
jgi:hypothetical protein